MSAKWIKTKANSTFDSDRAIGKSCGQSTIVKTAYSDYAQRKCKNINHFFPLFANNVYLHTYITFCIFRHINMSNNFLLWVL